MAAAEPAARFWAATTSTAADRVLCSHVLEDLLVRVQSTLERCPRSEVPGSLAASLFNLIFLPSIARLVDEKRPGGVDPMGLVANAVRELLLLQRVLGDSSGLDDTNAYWRRLQLGLTNGSPTHDEVGPRT
jgi:hypothetical protein